MIQSRKGTVLFAVVALCGMSSAVFAAAPKKTKDELKAEIAPLKADTQFAMDHMEITAKAVNVDPKSRTMVGLRNQVYGKLTDALKKLSATTVDSQEGVIQSLLDQYDAACDTIDAVPKGTSDNTSITDAVAGIRDQSQQALKPIVEVMKAAAHSLINVYKQCAKEHSLQGTYGGAAAEAAPSKKGASSNQDTGE